MDWNALKATREQASLASLGVGFTAGFIFSFNRAGGALLLILSRLSMRNAYFYFIPELAAQEARGCRTALSGVDVCSRGMGFRCTGRPFHHANDGG